MSRYIDTDRMKEEETAAYIITQAKENVNDTTKVVNEIVHNKLHKLIDAAPTEDVERHGWWQTFDDGSNAYNCSECDFVMMLSEGTPKDKEYYYCLKCGAKMDFEEVHG